MKLNPREPAAAEHFDVVFGGQPETVWSAPGRVNLIGEHTDYNDGLCLPFAVEFRAECALRFNRSGRLRIASTQKPSETVDIPLANLAPGAVTGWAAYVAGAVWASTTPAAGLEVLIDSDIPPGAGLSSSAAIECATLGALGAENNLDLARAAQRAENEFVGVPSGLMDQAASVLSTAGHALLFDAQQLTATDVTVSLGSASLLVVDTCTPHQLNDGAYAERRQQCADAAQQLGINSLRDAESWQGLPPTLMRRARHVITENARVLAAVAYLQRGDVEQLGHVLTRSHASLRDDFQVTVPQLDLAVNAALQAGAWGARMTGGGFGGSIIALVNDANAVAEAVEKAFAEAGWAEPRWFLSRPQPGLSRVC